MTDTTIIFKDDAWHIFNVPNTIRGGIAVGGAILWNWLVDDGLLSPDARAILKVYESEALRVLEDIRFHDGPGGDALANVAIAPCLT